jgi:hypothetical protein
MLHNARMLLMVATWCTWACKMICLEDECNEVTWECASGNGATKNNVSHWQWSQIKVNNVWRSTYEHYTNKRRWQGWCSTTESYINRENAINNETVGIYEHYTVNLATMPKQWQWVPLKSKGVLTSATQISHGSRQWCCKEVGNDAAGVAIKAL